MTYLTASWRCAAPAVLMLSAAAYAPIAVAQPAVLEEPAAVAGGKMTTVVAAAVSSYDNLMGDISYLAKVSGNPDSVQMLQGTAGMFTQPVDKKKPWGFLMQTDGAQFVPLLCLPMKDFDAAMQMLAATGVEPDDLGDGVFEAQVPGQAQSVYIKQQGPWALLSNLPDAFGGAPADPGPMFTEMAKGYSISVKAMVQNIPPMYRQVAIGSLREGIEAGLEQEPDESDETFAKRQELAELQLANIERLFTEFDTATIGWGVDQSAGKTFLDVVYTVVPGSKLAEQVAVYQNSKTDFAGFIDPAAAMTMGLAVENSPELMQSDIEQMKLTLATVREKAENEIDNDPSLPNDEAREVMKSALGDVMEVVEATVSAGKMDAGAKVMLSDASATITAGGHVVNPEKIETALRKLVKLSEGKPDFPGVKWNAATHAGVSFHTMSLPIPADAAPARKLFGETVSVALGIGESELYLAAGSDYMDAMKSAIDASKASPGKKSDPLMMVMSLKPFIATAQAVAPPNPEAAAVLDMLSDALEDAEGSDRILMTQQYITDGIKMRFEMEEGVLKAIGAAATLGVQQRAQGGF
ncbi:hypothetical protein Pla175_05200 [Pirellulimonas nuda]|uniref:Uncharacterized protein n=1 Tax=Pirellulimonas nuda TaxID=2528009 RepID=A0A518D6Q6_9BACT|nr:hypothetical protein [Pirellulimonas nuda]QDU87164.1 hypothetical protein Pla175_05200 [Pirellulimonas nuda]